MIFLIKNEIIIETINFLLWNDDIRDLSERYDYFKFLKNYSY